MVRTHQDDIGRQVTGSAGRRWWAVLAMAAALAACQTWSNTAKLDQGLHGQYVREFESAKSVHTAEAHDVYTLCQSYFEIRHYAKFRDCEGEYRKRFAPGKEKPLGDRLSFYLGPLDSMASILALDQGDREEAMRRVRRAMEILEHMPTGYYGDDVPWYRAQFVIRENAALAYALMGEEERARKVLRRLEVPGNILMEPPIADRRSAAVARAYVALGDYAKARKALDRDISAEKGLASFVKILPTYYIIVPATAGTMEIEDLYKRGEFYRQFMAGKIAAATGERAYAREVFDVIAKVKNFSAFSGLYWKTLYERGKLSRAESRLAEALVDFERAMDVAETMRSRIDETRSRIGFVANIERLYHDAIWVAIELGRYRKAFEYLERSKARALVDMLGARAFGKSTPEPEVREAVAKIRGLSTQPILVAEAESNGRRGVIMEELQSALRVSAPKLAQLVTVATLGVTEIQAKLGPEETLIEYYQAEDTLIAFVVTRKAIKAKRLAGGDVVADVRRLREALDKAATGDSERLTGKLYATLIAPIEGDLKGQLLTVVPHGALHYLPFSALRRGDRRLVESYFLRVLPSASVLQFSGQKRRRFSDPLLAFGNPDLADSRFDLPGAEREVRLLASERPGTQILTRGAATETAFKAHSGGYRMIHVAAHGYFSADDPLESGLLLSPSGEDDGRLTVDEVYDLRLDADLVTLSACETGLGEVLNGDDVVGFSRGFLYAGADSVVGSLWRVPDEATTELMNAFYAHLRRVPPAQALSLAQRDMIRKTPDPRNWAAFQVMGFGA